DTSARHSAFGTQRTADGRLRSASRAWRPLSRARSADAICCARRFASELVGATAHRPGAYASRRTVRILRTLRLSGTTDRGMAARPGLERRDAVGVRSAIRLEHGS